jgi:hypothetical protein
MAERATPMTATDLMLRWPHLTPHQRLAILDLMKSTMQAELDKHIAEMNAEFASGGIPLRIEVDVRMVFDHNRDPRLER